MITGFIFMVVVAAFMVGNIIMMFVEVLFNTHIASVNMFHPGMLVYWIIVTIILRVLVEVYDTYD